MNEIDIGQPSCYKIAYQEEHAHNLVISFTPSKGYFLYHNELNASKLCIASTSPNYYIFNPGSTCVKIVNFLKDKQFKNIICIGSSKAGLASLLWAEILDKKLPNDVLVFALSFSPQTKLYPFNESLYFPSYHTLWSLIERNESMKNCAMNYGDLSRFLAGSELEGMIVYPKGNQCDRVEAERIQLPNIKLKPIDYPLHGSFLPFMKQAKNDDGLIKMVNKIFDNAMKDDDINATIPESKTELFNIIKSIDAPTIEEWCRAMFFEMDYRRGIDNYHNVQELGFI